MQEAEARIITRHSFISEVKCPHCGEEQYIEVYESEDCQIEQCFYCKKEIHLFLIIITIALTKEECPTQKNKFKVIK